MSNPHDLERENRALRERLSRLSQASLRINESLDYQHVLDEVVHVARELTGARYGFMILMDEVGSVRSFLTSGVTPEERQGFVDHPDVEVYVDYLVSLPEPLRVPDFFSHASDLWLPEFPVPMEVGGALPFLAVPIRHHGKRRGGIYVADKETGGAFSSEDEETLVMFASQAGMAIDNARRHREEQKATRDLETLINASPVGVVVLDALSGEVVSINREAVRIISELLDPGRPIADIWNIATVRRADGTEISLSTLDLPEVFSTGEALRAEEIVIRVPEGRAVTSIVNAIPVVSANGTVETFVVTMQDMTPMKEVERVRAEFLGMVSHELRTPLSTIKGSVETLLQESSDLHPAETAQFHNIILDQSNNMRHLIRDLLDVAQIETGSLQVAAEPARVAVLIDQANNRFVGAGGKNRLQIEVASDVPDVMADRRRVVQVLNNLLSNAARHSPESSAVRVTATAEGVHVAISVIDEGVGLSADRLPHLFRKFSKLGDPKVGSNFGGSGLGLAICKGIVEAHGGRIWAESDGPGLGSRFTFTIPAATSDSRPDYLPLRSDQTDEGPKRILAVDDDPFALKYVRDALVEGGYLPLPTGDPDDIGRLMEEEEPHLVLLDLMLPGTDGVQLMRDVFSHSDVPVIFVSAYGRDAVIATALASGAVDYIVKPFSPSELKARIEAALRRREAPEDGMPPEEIALGDLQVNFPKREVLVSGNPARLTSIEFRMLSELSIHGGQVLTYEHLLHKVWGPDNSGDLRPMRTVVRSLRQKLGDDASNPKYIFTQPRVGYLMAKGERVSPSRPG